eukprot:TRINITY_DN15370_c0_g1_i1.p1 TRINITY_DN15370_c0_g1~~TRINITY_DN15370_c0_g1_i1.p1  ORF type:complete len:377 (-),score=56.68 TRINITY_DN15370_c0_g1_i1:136-1266(-)
MSVTLASEVEGKCTDNHKNSSESLPSWLYGENNRYKITKTTLGTGTFSLVRLGLISNIEKQRVAIKIVNKKTALDTTKRVTALRKEIEILFALADHPNIVHLIEVLEDTNNVYLIFEAQTSDLKSYRLQNGGKLTEQETLHIFPQIVSAVKYCHEKSVVHRDIKLENILYSYTKKTSNPTAMDLKVCLADFGFATFYEKEAMEGPNASLLNKWCGSPFTVAPEIINRTPYLPEPVDVWSLGSLLYTLICGYPPFKAKTLAKVFKRTQKGKVKTFPKTVGICSRTLIKRMLTVEPEKRIRLDKIQDHSFFKYAAMKEKDKVPNLLAFQKNSTAQSAPTLEQYMTAPDLSSSGGLKNGLKKLKLGRKASVDARYQQQK